MVALLLGAVFVGLRCQLGGDRPTCRSRSLAGARREGGPGRAGLAAATRRRRRRPRRGWRASWSPRSRPAWSQVQDLADRSIVTIKGDGFFEPGSAVIVGQRAAAARAHRAGAERHAGPRADHRPHRQPADPHAALSVELASVAGARRRGRRPSSRSTVEAERLRAEGRADSEPSPTTATPQAARRTGASRSRCSSRAPAAEPRRARVRPSPSSPGLRMKKILQTVFHPIALSIYGLLALAALIWWVGPLIAFGERRPLDGIWERVHRDRRDPGARLRRSSSACARWRRKRADAAMVGELAAGPDMRRIARPRCCGSASPRRCKVLEESAARRASARCFKRGQYLYELPWYMFIGAPGSGKTTALMNAGLTFPLAGKMGQASVKGVGGTRNCDWWFTDEAVLIDTAGRYTLAAVRREGRRRRLGELPRPAEEDAAAPADQRRAADGQRPGPAAADAGRAQGARAEAAHAPAGAARAARRAAAGLRAGHQVRPDRRLQRDLRRARQRGARAGLGLHASRTTSDAAAAHAAAGLRQRVRRRSSSACATA